MKIIIRTPELNKYLGRVWTLSYIIRLQIVELVYSVSKQNVNKRERELRIRSICLHYVINKIEYEKI